MSKYRRVLFLRHIDRQVTTVSMETTQLVLRHFKNFLIY